MVQGRKIPLYKLRQKLLQKHSAYMRLDTVNTMKREQLTTKLKGLHYLDLATMSTECLRKQLQSAQTSRSLCLWHDHATILKTGFIMITVHVMYDPIVFLIDEEYNQGHPGKNICVQAEVEQPEIYLLATRSSCVEDQAALVGDRLECLPNLAKPVVTDNGIEITDTMRFFTGDHPAVQFEQGTKQGGNYKCGACGCKEMIKLTPYIIHGDHLRNCNH